MKSIHWELRVFLAEYRGTLALLSQHHPEVRALWWIAALRWSKMQDRLMALRALQHFARVESQGRQGDSIGPILLTSYYFGHVARMAASLEGIIVLSAANASTGGGPGQPSLARKA